LASKICSLRSETRSVSHVFRFWKRKNKIDFSLFSLFFRIQIFASPISEIKTPVFSHPFASTTFLFASHLAILLRSEIKLTFFASFRIADLSFRFPSCNFASKRNKTYIFRIKFIFFRFKFSFSLPSETKFTFFATVKSPNLDSGF